MRPGVARLIGELREPRFRAPPPARRVLLVALRRRLFELGDVPEAPFLVQGVNR